MPYIKQENRERARTNPQCAGELNYAITMLIIEHIKKHGLSYQVINNVLGSLASSQERVGEFVSQGESDVVNLSFSISTLCYEYYFDQCKDCCVSSNFIGVYTDIKGALEGAKLELYRRIASVYEDQAIIRNGDVYNTE